MANLHFLFVQHASESRGQPKIIWHTAFQWYLAKIAKAVVPNFPQNFWTISTSQLAMTEYLFMPANEKVPHIIFKKGQSPGLFLFIFVVFSLLWQYSTIDYNGKSIDCVVGIQTLDRRMVGADKSDEQWRLPNQCDQIRGFLALWATIQSRWQQLFYPNRPHC